MDSDPDKLPESFSVYYGSGESGGVTLFNLLVVAAIIGVVVFEYASWAKGIRWSALAMRLAIVIPIAIGARLWSKYFYGHYSKDEKGGDPYLRMNRTAITLLGDSSIPWRMVAFIDVIPFRNEANRPPLQFLVLGMNDELFRTARTALPGFAELTRYNPFVQRHVISRWSGNDVRPNSFVSVEISGNFAGAELRLTEPNARIAEMARAYWNAAGGAQHAGPFAGRM